MTARDPPRRDRPDSDDRRVDGSQAPDYSQPSGEGQPSDERPRPTRHARQEPLASTDERAGLPELDRRDFLQTVGAAGVAASLAGASSGSAAAQSGDWEAAAEERIAEHRQGELEVVAEDSAGEPIPDATVEVEMQEHDYGFGCAVHAEFLTRGTEWGDPIEGLTDDDQQRYRETLQENFNQIVLENLQKWNLWEDNTEIADEAVNWGLEQGMDVRGHVCLWGNVQAWAVPPDVVEAMGVEWPDGPEEYEGPDHDAEYVREQSMAHLEEIIDHYGDQITEWDVVNEVFHQPAMIQAIEGDGVTPETAPILGDWYERAQAVADQYDVGIATNDYNTLNGPIGNARDRYETQLQYLVEERGIDLDGIGLQGHFRARTGTLSAEQIWEACERYSGYGAGLRCTEFDVFQGDWTDEAQAEYLYRFLKVFFSHPNTDDFLIWGHWTPLHWGDDLGGEEPNAPFYREDWSEKPALERYRNLVFDQWWTEDSGTTDDSGTYATQAFLGEHEVRLTVDGEVRATKTVSVTDAASTTTVTIGPGDGGDPDPEPPTSPGDQWTNSVTSTSIELGWTSASGATSYELFLEGSSVGTSQETTYTFTDLSPETEYTVGIRSVNDAGSSDLVETTVETAADGPTPTCEDSLSVADRTVCDANGDGYYEDVNGDGELTHADVQEFFSVQHRPTWKQPQYFDFNENDVVGHGDVIALFEDVATGKL